MTNKKGISPLIATVLIIGFTILLAVLVVNFILNVTEEQTDQTECDAEAKNKCIEFLSAGSYEATINPTTPTEVTIFNFAVESANFLISSVDNATAETIEVNETDAEIGTGETATVTFSANVARAKVFPIVSHTTDNGISCSASCSDSALDIRR